MLEKLATIKHLDKGSHHHQAVTHSPDNLYCLMEAVAYVAGETWSDEPECVCPVLGSFGRSLNDYMTSDVRQQLIHLIPDLIGTRATPDVEEKRAYLLVDWAVRVFLPIVLRHSDSGMADSAEDLESLPTIVDQDTAADAAVWHLPLMVPETRQGT